MNTLEVILYSLFGLWVVLIPSIMIMKIKYMKKARQKAYRGITELFSFFSIELWYAGLTFGFPMFGRDRNLELKKISRRANFRLFLLYLTVSIQVTIVVILNKAM